MNNFKKFSHPALRKYAANTVWLGIEKVTRIFLALGVGALVARYLGPENFGALNYAIGFVFLVSTFSTLGLEGVVVRELVKAPQDQERILGTSIVLRFLGTFFAWLVILLMRSLLGHTAQTNSLILLIAAGLFFQIFQVFDYYFQAKVLSKYSVLSQLIQLALTSGLKIILIVQQAPLFWFALVLVIENALNAILWSFFYQRREHSLSCLKFDPLLGHRLFREALPLIFSSAFISIYMRIDQVMIKNMLSPAAVGYYSAAVNVCESVYFLPMIITASLFPALIQSQNQHQELNENRIQKLYDFLVLLSLGLAVTFFLFSEMIIHILFGKEYSNAVAVLQIYSWSCIFIFIGVASEKWLLAKHLQRFTLYRTLLGAVLNIALNFIFIPRWGINGSAVATLISQAVTCYFSLALFKPTRNNFMLITKAVNPIKAFRRLSEGIF